MSGDAGPANSKTDTDRPAEKPVAAGELAAPSPTTNSSPIEKIVTDTSPAEVKPATVGKLAEAANVGKEVVSERPKPRPVDPSEIDTSDLTPFTRDPDTANDDIQAIFPDADQAENAKAAELAIAKSNADHIKAAERRQNRKKAKADAKAGAAAAIPADTEATSTAAPTEGKEKGEGERKESRQARRQRAKRKAKKASRLEAIPPSAAKLAKDAAEAAKATTTAAAAVPKAASTREECKAKLDKKRGFLKQFGSRGTRLLGQVGASIDDLGDAALAESRGERVSSAKQEELLKKSQGVLGNAFKGMDAKERRLLARKTDQIMPMAKSLLKKVLGGPGKKKKPAHSDSSDDDDTEDDDDDRDGSDDDDTELDPKLQDLVESVHNPPKKLSRRERAAATPQELPLRPRTRRPAPASASAATPATPATSATPAAPASTSTVIRLPNGQTIEPAKTRNQRKNKKKRDRLKHLKAQVAHQSSSATPQVPAPTS